MLRATTLVRKAAIRADAVVDSVTLDHAARQALPETLTGEGGLSFSPALDTAVTPEAATPCVSRTAVSSPSAPQGRLCWKFAPATRARLLRLAWQLGGSHVPAEIGADVLYVPRSAAELVRGQGCSASPVTRAFKPERAAHDHSLCGHDHHDHDHKAHDHKADDHAAHDHGHHDHAHAHDTHDHGVEGHAPHVHGPDCKHDH